MRDAAILRRRFDSLAPWITRFETDGMVLGGDYDAAGDTRLRTFFEAAGPLAGKRILELGPLEGGHTLQLARRGARVVAVEGREANHRRCLLIKDVFKLDNVDFVFGDVRSLDAGGVGRFDMVFNVGVLYHLDEPWATLRSLSQMAPAMFLWTHCTSPEDANATVRADGISLAGRRFREGAVRRRLTKWLPGRVWLRPQLKDPLSGLQHDSFWPTRESLEAMLKATGWGRVRWLGYDANALPGPAACVWAEGVTSAHEVQ